MSDILTYEVMLVVWFFLWGLLWAVYFMLDGFDLGIGTLLPFLGGTESEKRMMFNASGPFWDGNEVWLITAGGVTFAAFPKAYAVLFSSLYAPLLILLFALIFRAVSFEFRNKIDSPGWRKLWNTCQFLGSLIPALLLGVAFANLFQGIPINQDGVYMGNLMTLLNLYGLAGGIFFVLMFTAHGAIWLGVRTTGELHDKARSAGKVAWLLTLVAFCCFLALSATETRLFDLYLEKPLFLIIPILAVAGLGMQIVFILKDKLLPAFMSSSLFIVSVTFFGVAGMFPALVPSSQSSAYSVTVYNGASTFTTLTIMLVVVLICVPVIIGYQAWVYKIFSYKLKEEDLRKDHAY